MASPLGPGGAGHALRRFAWTVPEWPGMVLVLGAWVGAAHHAGHRHPLGLDGWVGMVVAMMVPATLPIAGAVGLGSMWHRRYRAPAIFLATYVAIWTVFGVVALALWSILGSGRTIDPGTAAGGMLLAAALWHVTKRHNRFLKRCHRALPLGSRGLAADRSCARYGAYHAWQCVGTCWPVMLAMVPGHPLPGLMVAAAAVSTWERLVLRPRPRVAAAVLAALAAVTLLVGV